MRNLAAEMKPIYLKVRLQVDVRHNLILIKKRFSPHMRAKN